MANQTLSSATVHAAQRGGIREGCLLRLLGTGAFRGSATSGWEEVMQANVTVS